MATKVVSKADQQRQARSNIQATPAEKARADAATEKQQAKPKADLKTQSPDASREVLNKYLDQLDEPVQRIGGGANNGWRLLIRKETLDTRGAAAYALVNIAYTAMESARKAKDAEMTAKNYADVFERYAEDLMLTDDEGKEVHPSDWSEVVVALLEHAATACDGDPDKLKAAGMDGWDDEQARPVMVNATRMAITRAANVYAKARDMVPVSPSGQRRAGRRGRKAPVAIIAIGNQRHTFWGAGLTEDQKDGDTLALFNTVLERHNIDGVRQLTAKLEALAADVMTKREAKAA